MPSLILEEDSGAFILFLGLELDAVCVASVVLLTPSGVGLGDEERVFLLDEKGWGFLR